MAALIITNGDAAGDLLAAAGKPGSILAWRDVLHEGPILGGSIEESSAARVPWLADRFRIDPAAVREDFAERDATMRNHAAFEHVEIWFEHDLFDQLQLVQILAFFAEARRTSGLVLVQADDFLGRQRADTILRFESVARPVVAADLELAASAWGALASPTPEAVARLAMASRSTLPFLLPALLRFIEELPAPATGLTRTEATVLAEISGGNARPSDIFYAVIAAEDAAFMGDLSFFRLLDDLAFAETPSIAGLAPSGSGDAERFQDAVLELTMAGEDVLAGEADQIDLNGIDRWWAGTKLKGRSVWRYDRGDRRLVPPDGSGE